MSAQPKGTLINPMARHLEAIGGPIRITHAEGVRLYDETGRSWIDCETGSGVFSLGHRNRKVCHTVKVSLDDLDLGNHHLVSRERGRLASQLSMHLTFSLNRIFFGQVNKYQQIGWSNNRLENLTFTLQSMPHKMYSVFNVSAGESVDCAVKLARGVTGKHGIICASDSYHGGSGYALAASAPIFAKDSHARIAGFIHVPYGPIDAIAHEFDKNADIAAVLLEPVAIESGCRIPPDGYLQNVRDLCHERGALLIVDESVTGLGRTGSVLACVQQEAIPDILSVGHALGGGVYPIYATCHREEIDGFYIKNPFVHVSTFGGGEVGCAAASDALTELSEDWLLENVQNRGTELRHEIKALHKASDARIRAVRGIGLANAIEMIDARAAADLQRMLFDRGVFCRRALLAPQSLLFLPPLTITTEEIAEIASAVRTSVNKLGMAPT